MAKDVIINFKGNFDSSQMKSSLDGFQKVLANLKLPSDLSNNLTQGFEKANSVIDQIEKRLSSGFKTNSDVSKLSKDFDQLDHVVEDLNKDIGKISNNHIQLSVDTKEIKEAQKYAQDLRKQLSQRIEANGLKEVNKAVNELHQGISKSKGIERFQEAFKSGNIEEASRALQQLKANSDAFSDSMRKATYDDKIKVFEQALKNLRQDSTFQKLSTDMKTAENTTKELTQQGIDKLRTSFSNAATDMEKLPSAIRESKNATIDAANGMRQMNAEMEQLKSRASYFFGLVNGAQLFRRVIQDALETVKELDAAMTATAVVTDFSVGDMWKRLPEYSKLATELGATLQGTYETMTLFYQQGLNTEQAFALGTEAMKMARIAGLDYEDATNRMTAALRGFNMELNEVSAQRVNDVYSELAAIAATDVDELSTAMDKTASLANSVGMSFEVTSAFLTQGIETTRESADSIGTALKTVLARFTEVKKASTDVVNVDGEEVNVNKVEAALKSVGIQLRDTNGEFRELDDVFLELSSKWDSLDKMSQRYIATMAAGSRQQSRFIAMMSDYDRTMQLVNAATNSAGASQTQFDKTLESMEAKLNKLKDAWQQFTMGIANSTMLKGVIDILTKLIETINKLTSSSNGFVNSVSKIGVAIAAFKGGGALLNKALNGLGQKIGMGLTQAVQPSMQTAGLLAGSTFVDSMDKGVNGSFGRLETRLQKLKKVFSVEYWGTADPFQAARQSLDNYSNAVTVHEAAMQQQVAAREVLNASIEKQVVLDEAATSTIYEREAAEMATKDAELAHASAVEIANTAEEQKIIMAQAAIAANGESTASLDVYNLALQQNLSQETARNLAIAASIDEETAQRLITLLSAGAISKENMALLQNTSLQAARAQWAKKGILAKTKDIALLLFSSKATKGQIIANIGLASSEQLAAGSAGALATALYSLPIGWIIAGVAAVVASLVVVSKVMKDMSVSEQLKRAQEATKMAADSAEEAASRYQELNDSLNSLSDGEKELDNLIEGTVAFNEKIIELNNQVIALVQSFKELAPYIETGKYGQLTISAEGIEKVKKQQEQAVLNSQSIYMQNLADEKRLEVVQTRENTQNALYGKNRNIQNWGTGGLTTGVLIAGLTGNPILAAALGATALGSQIDRTIKDKQQEVQFDDFQSLILDNKSDLLSGKTNLKQLIKDNDISESLLEGIDTSTAGIANLVAQMQELDNAARAGQKEIDSYAQQLGQAFVPDNIKETKLEDQVSRAIGKVATSSTYDEKLQAFSKEEREFKEYNGVTLDSKYKNVDDIYDSIREWNNGKAGLTSAEAGLYKYIVGEQFTGTGGREAQLAAYNKVYGTNFSKDDSDVPSEEAIAKALTQYIEKRESTDAAKEFMSTAKGNEEQVNRANFLSLLTGDFEALSQAFVDKIGEGNFSDLEALGKQFDVTGEELEKLAKSSGLSADALLDNAKQAKNQKKEAQSARKGELAARLARRNNAQIPLDETGTIPLAQYQTTLNKKDLLDATIEQARIITFISEIDEGSLKKVEETVDHVSENLNEEAGDYVADSLLHLYGDGNKKAAEEIQDALNNINYDNPIEGAHQLQEAIQNSSGAVQETLQEVEKLGQTELGTDAQLKYLANSQEINDSVSDLIKKNGKITGQDVRELSTSYRDLELILDNTGTSATALSKVLESLNDGSIGIDMLNESFLHFMDNMFQSEAMLDDLQYDLANFDPGTDTGIGADLITQTKQKIDEFIEAGEYGNEQLASYIDRIFGQGAFDAYAQKQGQNLVTAAEHYQKQLAGIEKNLLPMWKNAISSGDFNRSALAKETGAKVFTKKNGEIGLDAGTATTKQLVEILQDTNGGITKIAAEAMLADFKNNATEYKEKYAAEANDFAAAISTLIDDTTIKLNNQLNKSIISEEFLQKLAQKGGKKYIDVLNELGKQEGILGVKETFSSIEEAIDRLNAKGIHIFPELDAESKTYGADIVNELDIIYSKTGEVSEQGKNLVAAFTDNQGNVNLKDMLTELENVTGSADEAKAAVQELLDSDAFKDTDGKELTLSYDNIKLDKDALTTNLQSTLDEAAKKLDFQTQANMFKDAFQNIDITVNSKQLDTALGNAEQKARDVQTATGNIKEGANTAGKAVREQIVNSLKDGRTQADKLNTTFVTLANSIRRAQNSVKNYSGVVVGAAKAEGGLITRKEQALTGELGPELYSDPNGKAYLLGAHGPEIATLNKGGIVFTAKETKEIFRGKKSKISMPAHAYQPSKNQGSSNKSKSKSSSKSSSSSSSKSSEKGTYDRDLYKEYQDNIDETSRKLEKLNFSLTQLSDTVNVSSSSIEKNINAQIKATETQIKQTQKLATLRKTERDAAIKALNSAAGKTVSKVDSDGSVYIDEASIKKIITGLNTDSDKYKKVTDALSKLDTADNNYTSILADIDKANQELYELKKIPAKIQAAQIAMANRLDNIIDLSYNFTQSIEAEQRYRDRQQRYIDRMMESEDTSVDALTEAWVGYLESIEREIEDTNIELRLTRASLQQDMDTINNALGYQAARYENGRLQIDMDAFYRWAKTQNTETSNAMWNTITGLQTKVDKIQTGTDNIEDLKWEFEDWKLKYEDEHDRLLHEIQGYLIDGIQEQIDELQEIDDTINEANQKLMDSIRKNIQKERQARENEKTLQDIDSMRSRLAYLKMDTTGRNEVAIAELEQQLKDAEESFSDSLVDQSLDAMQESFDEASEQRQEQIKLLEDMREQMEKYPNWDELEKMYRESFDEQNHIIVDSALWIVGHDPTKTPNEQKNAIHDMEVAKNQADLYERIGSGEELKAIAQQNVQKQASSDLQKGISQMREGQQTTFIGTDGKEHPAYYYNLPGKGPTLATFGKSGEYAGYYSLNNESFAYKNGQFVALDDSDKPENKTYTNVSTDWWNNATPISKNGIPIGTEIPVSDGIGWTKDKKVIYTGGNSAFVYFTKTGYWGRYNDIRGENGFYRTRTKDKDIQNQKENSLANLLTWNGATSTGNATQDLNSVIDLIKKGQLSNWKKPKAPSTSSSPNTIPTSNNSSEKTGSKTTSSTISYYPKYTGNKYLQDALVSLGIDGSYANRAKIAKANGISNYSGTAAQNTYLLDLLKKGKLKKYASGGLVTSTGLAWLDGTKSNPEYVLNADTTKSFINFANLAQDFMRNNMKSSNNTTTQGDANFYITVQVDQMNNDYDVERAIQMVQQKIVSSSNYRNVNNIRFTR